MGILKRSKTGRPGLLVALVLLWLTLLSGPAGSVEAITLNEGKIKAGLLYNFLKHTKWAEQEFASPSDKLRICLLGGDAFDGALYPLAGRTAQQRVINIRTLNRFDDGCHVIFIHRLSDTELENVLQQLRGRPVLTVSDISGFAQKGGMVEFTKGPDRRIHLRINAQAIKNSGLSIQERMLNLAELVN